eukprot:Pgem_evm1s19407
MVRLVFHVRIFFKKPSPAVMSGPTFLLVRVRSVRPFVEHKKKSDPEKTLLSDPELSSVRTHIYIFEPICYFCSKIKLDIELHHIYRTCFPSCPCPF